MPILFQRAAVRKASNGWVAAVMAILALVACVVLFLGWRLGLTRYGFDRSYYGTAGELSGLGRLGTDFNAEDPETHTTPLFAAVMSDDPGRVRALLRAGADPHKATSQGDYPLAEAIDLGNQPVISLLLKAGADPRHGDPPLWEKVIDFGDPATMDTLLRCGLSPNVRDTDDVTPLAYAAMLKRSAFIALLLRWGASASLRDNQGMSALDYAREAGDKSVI